MAAFLNTCRFNPSAGGTTDWTVASAVTGYKTPATAGAVNGRVYKYRAESANLSQWEEGQGAYSTGTGVLARTTVCANSSGDTSKINFTTVPQVAIVAMKEDLLSIEEANAFTAAQKSQARSNLGMADGHIPGEVSNGSAASGEVGEIIEFTLASTGLTNGAGAINLANGAFPAGDWDITAFLLINAGGATSLTNYTFSISATSATHDTSAIDRYVQYRNASGHSDPIISQIIGPHRRSLSGSATLFITGSAQFSNVLFATTKIRGRRMR
jgi:hypothetical protein